ncbi:unnamed protein product [Angiostrongylus costaricensis]|uniref:FIST_C domain-containing protein n=1 Tax=Angiostrongylus costaricensis TaxID=334426 RepID=A0A0R3PVC8_ANGCS|nr:unnamed protein product [Angiostrongylus costaricensis]
MQARMIGHDVTGLTELRKRHPFNAVYGIGGKLFPGTYDSGGVFDVGIFVNTSLVTYIDLSEEITTRI